jgi:hypothetical protein
MERFRIDRALSVVEVSPGVFETNRYYAYTDEIGASNLPVNPNANDTTFYPAPATGLRYYRGGYQHIVSSQDRDDLIASGVVDASNFTLLPGFGFGQGGFGQGGFGS